MGVEMTKLGFVNKFFFQWFFVRLVGYYDIHSMKFLHYGFMFGVIPLTGWSTGYIFIKDLRRIIFGK
jgi:hypothetical protein